MSLAQQQLQHAGGAIGLQTSWPSHRLFEDLGSQSRLETSVRGGGLELHRLEGGSFMAGQPSQCAL